MARWARWSRKKITADLCERLASYIREGCTLKIAAEREGIPRSVIRSWYEAGEREVAEIYEQERGYPSHVGMLYLALTQAAADLKARLVRDLLEAGTGRDSSPGSAGWLLERIEKDFAPAAARVEVSGPSAGPLVVEGRAVVGLADVIALAKELGAGHLFGLPDGSTRDALPAASEVLPDPSESEQATGSPAHVHGP